MYFDKEINLIIKAAIDKLWTQGLRIDTPEEIEEQIQKRQRKLDDPEENQTSSTFSDDDLAKWRDTLEAKIIALKKIKLQIQTIIPELVELSGGKILYNDGRIFIFPEWVWKCIEISAANAEFFENLPGNIWVGGTSPYLYENRELLEMLGAPDEFIPHKARINQFRGILEDIKKHADEGIIGGSSIPVLTKDGDRALSYFEHTEIMQQMLPDIVLKSWLDGASDEQMKKFATWPKAFDSYCPIKKPLYISAEIFASMMRSIGIINNMGITSMPNNPGWGDSDDLCLLTTLAEALGLLVFCITKNPSANIMVGVMFEVLQNAEKDAKLEDTWSINIMWHHIMEALRLYHVISSGATTNALEYNAQARFDSKRCWQTYARQAPKANFRHGIGHNVKGLAQFVWEGMRNMCEHIANNRSYPFDDYVTRVISGPSENYYIVSDDKHTNLIVR